MKKIICIIILSVLLIYTCSCGLGHSHIYTTEAERVEPTCEKDGYVIKKCECGNTVKNTLKATGHDYQSTVIKEATCTVNGKTLYKCSVCGDSYEKETTKSHSYDSNKRCTMCGKLKEGTIKTDYSSWKEYSWGGGTTEFKISSIDYKKYLNGLEVTVRVTKTNDRQGSTGTNPIYFYVSLESGFNNVIDSKMVSVYGLRTGQSTSQQVTFYFNFDPTEDYSIKIYET